MKKEEMIDEVRIAIFSYKLFNNLLPHELDYLVDKSSIIEIKKGQALIHQGDIGHCMYLILRGTFSVWIRIDHRDQKVGTAEEGVVIGEMALLTDDIRSATVIADTDALLISIGTEAFSEIVNRNPAIIKGFYKKSLSRLKNNFSGWFPAIGDEVPPFWRQTMMVLLVFFPIVVLKVKYFDPQLVSLNRSLALFISFVLSLVATSLLMPLAIYFFEWWLYPKKQTLLVKIFQYFIILMVYTLEIIAFWWFF